MQVYIQKFLEIQDISLQNLKPQYFFNLFSVMNEREFNQEIFDKIIVPWVEKNTTDLLPEEIVILLKMLDKCQNQDFSQKITQKIESDYLILNIDENSIDFKEAMKIYVNIKYKSPDFDTFMQGYILDQIQQNKVMVDSMPYLIPQISNLE